MSRGSTDSYDRKTASGSRQKLGNRLWLRMSEIYGSAWTAQAGAEPTKLWTDFLATINPRVIGDAITLAVMSGNRFPPNLAEFAGYCQQAAGLPDVAVAYRHAAALNWSHPVIYETYRRVGAYEVRTYPENRIYPAWRGVYAKVCAEWMQGSTFESPSFKRLEKGHSERASESVVKESLDQIRQAIGDW